MLRQKLILSGFSYWELSRNLTRVKAIKLCLHKQKSYASWDILNDPQLYYFKTVQIPEKACIKFFKEHILISILKMYIFENFKMNNRVDEFITTFYLSVVLETIIKIDQIFCQIYSLEIFASLIYEKKFNLENLEETLWKWMSEVMKFQIEAFKIVCKVFNNTWRCCNSKLFRNSWKSDKLEICFEVKNLRSKILQKYVEKDLLKYQ